MQTHEVRVKLEDVDGVKQTMRALIRLLHEVEAADPTLLPGALVDQAENARAVVDEWRQPHRHQRRRRR
jgi:hypothetical protein